MKTNKVLYIIIAVLIFALPYIMSNTLPFNIAKYLLGPLVSVDYILKVITFVISSLIILKAFGKCDDSSKKLEEPNKSEEVNQKD